MSKPKVLAVGVPWMITPSTPFMELQGPVGGPKEQVEVTFAAFFGLEQEESEVQLPCQTPPRQVAPSGPFRPREANQPSTPYRLVKVTFINVLNSWQERVSDEGAAEGLYDWSGVKKSAGYDLPDWREGNRILWATWRKTGLCPDPLMYEIEGSPKIAAGGSPSDTSRLRHFLMLGHDVNVEAVARRWVWEEGQNLPGW